MSTDYPPAQQPPTPGQNPYGQQPAPPYGQPPASPYAQQPAPSYGQPPAPSYGQPPAPSYGQPAAQPPAPGQHPYAKQPDQQPYPQPAFDPAAYAPPTGPMATARADNTALGVLVGVAATIVLALAYGGILRALSKDDGSTSEFKLFAIAVGGLIGLIVGKVGGRSRLLPVLSLVFALVAVVFGELFGDALIISHLMTEQGGSLSVSDIFFQHFGGLWDAWKDNFGFQRAFYLLCAAAVAFGLTKRVSA